MLVITGASERGEGAFEIGVRLFGIEAGADRTLAGAPRQMTPEHRLEFFRPVVSLKSHFRTYVLTYLSIALNV
jgi:hypothetical protein